MPWLRVCCIAGLLVLAACYQEISDSSATYAAVSKGPWAVDGIVLGSTMDSCREQLGEPDRELLPNPGVVIWQWTRFHQATITFDDRGRAVEILGSALTDRQGRTEVWRSAGEDEVRVILPAARVKKSYRPKGSGVISIGREHVGTTYTVSDDLGTYTFSFYQGNLSSIVGRALQ